MDNPTPQSNQPPCNVPAAQNAPASVPSLPNANPGSCDATQRAQQIQQLSQLLLMQQQRLQATQQGSTAAQPPAAAVPANAAAFQHLFQQLQQAAQKQQQAAASAPPPPATTLPKPPPSAAEPRPAAPPPPPEPVQAPPAPPAAQAAPAPANPPPQVPAVLPPSLGNNLSFDLLSFPFDPMQPMMGFSPTAPPADTLATSGPPPWTFTERDALRKTLLVFGLSGNRWAKIHEQMVHKAPSVNYRPGSRCRSEEETKAACIQFVRMVKSGLMDLGLSPTSEEISILTQELQAVERVKAEGDEEGGEGEQEDMLIDLPPLELNDIQGSLTWMKQFVARFKKMTEVAEAVSLMESRPDVKASVAAKMAQVSTSPIVWWTEEDDLEVLKGVNIHGYGQYEEIFEEPGSYFDTVRGLGPALARQRHAASAPAPKSAKGKGKAPAAAGGGGAGQPDPWLRSSIDPSLLMGGNMNPAAPPAPVVTVIPSVGPGGQKIRGRSSGAGEMPNKELVTKRFLKTLEAFQKTVAQELVVAGGGGTGGASGSMNPSSSLDPTSGHLAGIAGLRKKGGHALRPPSGRTFGSRASFGSLADAHEGPVEGSGPSSPSSPLDKSERLVLYTYLTTWGLPGDSMTEEGDVDLLAAAAAGAPNTKGGGGEGGEDEGEEEEGGPPPLPPLLAGTLGCSSFGSLVRSRCTLLSSKEDEPLLSALLDMLAEMHAVGEEERKRRKVGREQKRQKLSKAQGLPSAPSFTGGAKAPASGDGDEETASDDGFEAAAAGAGGMGEDFNPISGAGGAGSPLASFAREVPLGHQVLSAGGIYRASTLHERLTSIATLELGLRQLSRQDWAEDATLLPPSSAGLGGDLGGGKGKGKGKGAAAGSSKRKRADDEGLPGNWSPDHDHDLAKGILKHGLGRWEDILSDSELVHLNGSASKSGEASEDISTITPPPTQATLLARYKKIVLAFRRLLKKLQMMKSNVKIIGKMPGGPSSGAGDDMDEKQRELKAAARAIALQVMGGLGELGGGGGGVKRAPKTRAEMEDSGTESDEEMSVKGAQGVKEEAKADEEMREVQLQGEEDSEETQ